MWPPTKLPEISYRERAEQTPSRCLTEVEYLREIIDLFGTVPIRSYITMPILFSFARQSSQHILRGRTADIELRKPEILI